jgi:GntR family transcriptional regulator, rspAB operon transcriptional repressor
MSELGLAGVPIAPRPESLALSVYNTIRQSIIDGMLPAGTKVTEAGLAKQLGVSKTPVREALLRLKEIGLIEGEAASTGRIIKPSIEQVRDAYEVREALETKSARLAAERGDRALLVAARREAERTVVAANSGDIVTYRAADEAFHGLIAQSGGNLRLARLIADANALVTTLRQRDLPGVDASPLCASQHMQISEAVLAGRADDAVTLMREHVQHVAAEILKHF